MVRVYKVARLLTFAVIVHVYLICINIMKVCKGFNYSKGNNIYLPLVYPVCIYNEHVNTYIILYRLIQFAIIINLIPTSLLFHTFT